MLVGEETIAFAADRTSAFVSPRDSALRGGAEYRRHMAGVLVGRAISDAAKQIRLREEQRV